MASKFAVCKHAASAPHGCGLVAAQVSGYEDDGKPIIWRCNFCDCEKLKATSGSEGSEAEQSAPCYGGTTSV